MTHIKRHHRQYGILGMIVSLIIAGIYMYVVPAEAAAQGVIVRGILQYAHSLCWLLLAIASAIYAIKPASLLIRIFSFAALLVYAVFIVSFVSVTQLT